MAGRDDRACLEYSKEDQRGQPDVESFVMLNRVKPTTRATILGSVDAKPLLLEIARHMRAVNLEAVLIGNAAAALQGAPVTTVDFDFLFRRTTRNLAKLKTLARALGAVVLRPYYPASDLYRVVRDDDGLQVDFMATIHGVRSFEGLRARAEQVEIDDVTILVAPLPDIIRSKRAARRPRDMAVLDILEKTLEETPRPTRTSGRRRS
jgi:hypothetical protein